MTMRNGEFWIWYDDHCVPRLRGGGRHETFRKMFEHLDGFDHPVAIVETGCLEDPDNWEGNGCSSIMFDRYVATRKDGSAFYSVDLSPAHVEITRYTCQAKETVIDQGDSVESLKNLALVYRAKSYKPPIALLYLDASHLDWNNETPAANHHLNELYAIMPALREDTLVVVDDAPAITDDYPRIVVGGKGALVAKHAFAVGADLKFHDYQIGWTKMTNRPVPSTTDLRELLRRAREHQDGGRLAQADEIYRVVLVITGKSPTGTLERKSRAEACAFFGATAQQNGQLGRSVDWYRAAVVADPGWTDYRIALVKASYRFGMWEIARGEAERATRIAPEDHLTWKSLGDCELELENADAARAAYDREIELAPPGYLDALLDRCSVAVDTEDYETAKTLCERMMATANEKDAWHCLGMVHYRLGEHETAIECYRKAIAMKARDAPQVHWNLGLALHSIGRYREGWQEHEWRRYATHSMALSMPLRRFNMPVWNRQPPPAIIHVHGEAGSGDNISCMRYLGLMLDDGYRVRYETIPALAKLAQDSFPGLEVVERAKDYPGVYGIEPFDYHCPIGSLPAIYETDLDTVPWSGPYIKADPELAAKYAKLLHPAGDYQKVGMVWSSGIRLKEGLWMERYGRLKSMHFDELEPLFLAGSNAVFVNLQVGPERDQHRDFGGSALLDPLPESPTWAETAALVANLDVVVTPDTGMAHLAGAMGKPVLLLMHREGSWHFMVERPGAPFNRRSPWYPSTLIYRQAKQREWADAVAKVADDLRTGRWLDELLEAPWPWSKESLAAAAE